MSESVRKPWGTRDYLFTLTDSVAIVLAAPQIFAAVCRVDFSGPGFCVVAFEATIDSLTLRKGMVDLKNALSEIAIRRARQPYVAQWMARFDQQKTTGFHLDGATGESLLMLGYEPSTVSSQLFLADYSKAALDLGITADQFLKNHNPMYGGNEVPLQPYATEVLPATEGQSRIVLINNSALPFTADGSNALGVMHKAIIVTPDPNASRVVNSIMLITTGEDLSPEQQQEFLKTDHVSR